MVGKRVLIADSMSSRAAEILTEAGIEVEVRSGMTEAELVEVAAGFDGILVRSATKVTAPVFAVSDRLAVVGRAGIGVDNIDIGAATAAGVVVMNAPDGNATTTAEHAISLMMSVSRNIPQATASMRAGKWEKKRFKGREVWRKTLGIVGLGNIGKIVASRAQGLKMRVIAADPMITSEAARALGVEKVSLEVLYQTADYLSVHAPLNDHTRGLIGAEAFAQMKPEAFVINCARGGIVDEAALLDALETGQIAGAALDVFVEEPPPADHPLLAHDKVILTPHLGASTVEAQVAVAEQIANQMAALLNDATVTNALNAPSVSGEVMRDIAPYLDLGRRAARLAAQVHTGDVQRIEIRYQGVLASKDTRPVTAAALTEILVATVDAQANPVSAPSIAKDRGIAVETALNEEHGDFANLIEVRLVGPSQTEVRAALFGASSPRIVGIDSYSLDLVPSGTMMLVQNEDRPGVIGEIGSELGRREINVSRLVLGIRASGGRALSFWSTDQDVDDASLAALRDLSGVMAIRRLRLD